MLAMILSSLLLFNSNNLFVFVIPIFEAVWTKQEEKATIFMTIVPETSIFTLNPEENCQIQKCKDKLCPRRHPQTCKFGEECRFQTSCSYNHPKRCAENKAMEAIRLKRDIEDLKADNQKLKVETERKLDNLVNAHLKEIEELQSQNEKS